MKGILFAILVALACAISAETSFAQRSDAGTPKPDTIIVVDLLIVNRCTPPEGTLKDETSGNEIRLIGQSNSQLEPAEYSNGYKAEVWKNGEKYEFGVAYGMWNGNLRVIFARPMPGSAPNFSAEYSSTTRVYVNHNGIPLLSVDAVIMPGGNRVRIVVDFLGTCTYSSCGGEEERLSQFSGEREKNSGTTEAITSGITQIMPNPFSGATLIKYKLTEDAEVDISLFNVLGQVEKKLVYEPLQTAGDYSVRLDGDQLARGSYFLVLNTGTKRQVHTLIKTE